MQINIEELQNKFLKYGKLSKRIFEYIQIQKILAFYQRKNSGYPFYTFVRINNMALFWSDFYVY